MSSKGIDAELKLEIYRKGEGQVPGQYWLWPLYGAGLENLGVDEKPILVQTPSCGPDQLLVRHDAVGLCFSDTKIIKAGETHPRLMGRNMKTNPVVLGHEVSLTVMEVGSNLKGQYTPGDRFIVQADIYYKGVGLAYGYALQGGLSQFNIIGDEILHGDEGCYLLPVQPETGYAQAALTEPWACVTASYDVSYRAGWKPEGTVLIVSGPAAGADYQLGTPYGGGQPPRCVVTMGVTGMLLDELRRRAKSDGFGLVELGAPSAESLAQAKQACDESAERSFEDIVLLGADAALYEMLEPLAGKGGLLNLVGAEGLVSPARVDVGRLHYDNLSLTGTKERDISLAYEPIRTELLAGGKAAFLGAAGPMGQMHVQRALQSQDGPSLAVATDLLPDRLEVINVKFAQLIEARRGETELVLRAPDGQKAAEFNAGLMALTGGRGYDDIVVLAPSPGVIAGSVSMLAPGGVMNVFAGLSRGVQAPIDLTPVVNRGIRFTGTSGSAIRDMRKMLIATEAGELDTNLSVDAISGLNDVKKGLEGVIHQGFTGKVVIYPQILDFPLTRLEDLKDVLPNVYAKLGPNNSWTVEAEAQFLEELLP